MRTRPASIATIVMAIGLALTTLGLSRAIPYTVGGIGTPATVRADLWAHGTGISPALVALVALGLLAAISMRPTRGGRRSASWIAVLAAVLVVAGVAEPAQRDALLFASADVVLSVFVLAFHAGLIALMLSAVGEMRRTGDEEPVEPTPVVMTVASAAA
jgi:uncharacterized membrane protein YhaH (DUF805 family)